MVASLHSAERGCFSMEFGAHQRRADAALKEGRIDVGFGRIPLDYAALDRQLLRNEKLVAAVAANQSIMAGPGALHLVDLAAETTDRLPEGAATQLRRSGVATVPGGRVEPPAVHEVRELQTALGLVAAEASVCLVPASVERLRRDNFAYRRWPPFRRSPRSS